MIDWLILGHEPVGMRAGTSYTHHDHRADPVSVSGIQALIEGQPTEVGRPDVGRPDVGRPDVGRTEDTGTWGSPHAVAQLVRQHSRYVWCLLRRLGVEVLHLDDATQQVFIVAARRLDDMRTGSERSFLCGTAVRVASNFRRNCGRRSLRLSEVSLDELQSSAPNGELLLEQMRARRMLDYVLDKMNLELRTVFVLSEIEGLTAPEIASVVGCPLGTVSSRLRRAREQFREETTLMRETLSCTEASR